MENKLKCIPIMLPTEDKDSHLITIAGYGLAFNKGQHDPMGIVTNQHLYLVSDREIKEGDWVHYSGGQLGFPIGVYQLSDSKKDKMSLNEGYFGIRHIRSTETLENGKTKTTSAYLKIGYNIFKKDVQKVEATTDLSLGLPLIPESFIKEWVEKQGKIEYVYIFDPAQVLRKSGEIVISIRNPAFNEEDMKHSYHAGFLHGANSQHKVPTVKSYPFDEWFNKNY